MILIAFESLGGAARISLAAYTLISLGVALFFGWRSFKEETCQSSRLDTRQKIRLVLEAIVMAVFSLIFWPMLLFLVLIMEFSPASVPSFLKPDPTRRGEVPEFKILPDHLSECVEVDMLEVAHRISDPLGAVPELPFGHLHARWLLLRMHLDTGRSLRRFATPHGGPRGDCSTIHRGWAVVSMDLEITSYWVTEWERQETTTPDIVSIAGHGAQP